MTIQSLVSYDQSQEQACCTQGVLERATVTAMLAGYVSSQHRATNKITSTVVNTEAQTFRSWPRHQAAYSLGGVAATGSEVIKRQTEHGSDGNLTFTTAWVTYAGRGLGKDTGKESCPEKAVPVPGRVPRTASRHNTANGMSLLPPRACWAALVPPGKWVFGSSPVCKSWWGPTPTAWCGRTACLAKTAASSISPQSQSTSPLLQESQNQMEPRPSNYFCINRL